MKKKIVSYLILACSLIGLVTVGSCRDYDDYADLRAINKIDHQKFKDSLDRHRMDIDSIFEILKGMCKYNCDSLGKEVYKLDSTVTKWLLGGMVGDSLNDWIVLDSTFNDSNDIAGVLRFLNQKVKDLRHDIDSIGDTLAATDALLKAADSVLNQRITDLKAYVDSIADSLTIKDSLLTAYDKMLIDSIDTLGVRIYRLDSIVNCYIDTIDSIGVVVGNLKELIEDSIMPKLELLEDRIDTLEARVDSLMDAELKRITSLYVQGSQNPIFGSFALPVGLSSSILSTYYGFAEFRTDFPVTEDDSYLTALVVKNAGMELTTAEKNAISGFSQISINKDQSLMSDSADNAGKIYFTVNPNEVDAADTSIYSFAFLNSVGDTVKGAKLSDIKISKDTLKFGLNLTRAGSGSTGFYEAKVKIDDPDPLKPSIKLSAEDMKTVVSNTFEGGRINLSGLSGAIFQLARTQMDRNALNVAWKDSMGEHSVTSNYDVAVAAITPLSYSFGQGYSPWMKVVDRVDDFVSGISPITDLSSILGAEPSISIDLSSIKVDIDTNKVKIKFDSILIDKSGNVKVKVKMPTSIDAYNKLVYKDTTYTAAGLDSILMDVEKAFNTKTVLWEDSINRKIKYIVNEISESVDDMVKKIGNELTPVNTMFHNMYANFGNNAYVKKLNNLISRMQSLSNRLSNKLDRDFSSFLQPLVVYEGRDNSLHPMSNVSGVPSVFTGGSGHIQLFITSYTAELLAPAYKKYIAVVAGPGSDAVNTANSGDGFNTILEGNTLTVDFNAPATGDYTIYYSAIDYHGHVTAQRFYVRVTD